MASATLDRRVLGIVLGGARSATTARALLVPGHGDRPRLASHELLAARTTALLSEDALWSALESASASVVAVDAPLTLPPCLRCSAACTGPGESCESREARELWKAGGNALAGRLCEERLRAATGLRALPTMQLGVIAARGVSLARRVSGAGRATRMLEVYPRASLHRLSADDPRLATRRRTEPIDEFRARVVRGLEELIDDLPAPGALTLHELDAIVAAYTGWLFPERLSAPPADWPDGSGWIYIP